MSIKTTRLFGVLLAVLLFGSSALAMQQMLYSEPVYHTSQADRLLADTSEREEAGTEAAETTGAPAEKDAAEQENSTASETPAAESDKPVVKKAQYGKSKPVQSKAAVPNKAVSAQPETPARTEAVEAPAQAAVQAVTEEKKSPGTPYRILSSAEYKTLSKVVVKNTDNEIAANARIEVPLISSSSVYQNSKKEIFSVEPVEIKNVSGTRVGVFSLGDLAPGTETVIEIRTAIRASNPEFFADFTPADGAVDSGWLAAGNGIESDNSQIINLAAQITQNLENDWEKASAITRWVAANIRYDASAANRNSGALQALQSRTGVCEDYAALSAALARAAGIPARVVYGYTDNGNNWPAGGAFPLRGYRHAWVEYSLSGRGWVPAEPTRSSAKFYFGTLPHHRYIVQNYSNSSLRGSYKGSQLSISWTDSLE